VDLRADALRLGAALLAAAALAAPARAQAQAAATAAAGTAPAAAEPSVALGRRAYTSYCTRCHGINLVVSSSAFFDLRTFPRHDKERFKRSVLEGTRAMPAWKDTIKPEELESIWLFIGSVNGW
jgi:mono/diheme cytochrome c family protein